MRWLSLAIACLFFSQAAIADIELRPGSKAHFAHAAEGAAILGQKDEFIQRLSPFDRAARMKTADPVSEETFLAFVRSNVTNWSEPEQARVEAAVVRLKPTLEKLTIALPKTVFIVKTTGAEEGGAFYTRDSAIILPQKQMEEASAELLARTIAHELFHIISRTAPKLREQLYQAIGFKHVGEVELPARLRSRKITNPDAPLNNHGIRLRSGETEVWAVPVLLSKSENYDPARGGEFFNYLQLQFLIAEKFPGPQPQLVDPSALSGFFEQVGRNTDYIIHPEEILAENFALLVTGATNLPSPEVIDKIRRVLEQK